jgi:hypothetical protein
MKHPLNRTADEVIDAMALCCLAGNSSAFLIGDNEMARLVEEYRKMRSLLADLKPDGG